MSKAALWITSSAPSTKARNSATIPAKRGLSARNARVSPVPSCAPISNSRSGLRYLWNVRPVGRRSISSTQPISTTRLPFFHSRPVVSVSRMMWRMCRQARDLDWMDERKLRRSNSAGATHGFAQRRQLAGGALADRLVARQHVDAFVVGVAGMSLHPAPVDAVAAAGLVQALPQVAVLDRVATGGLPAAPDPVRHPQGDALAHVLGVGVQ